MRRILVCAVIAFALSLPISARAQGKNKVVGTWKLVSVVSKTEQGQVNKTVYGEHPKGFITYGADGRMMVVITEDGRKPLSVNDRVAAPMEERAQAFSTMTAYAGTYTFSGDKVVHHVEIASIPNWVGSDQSRTVKLQGDRLIITTPPLSRGGTMQTLELTWERLKPSGKASKPAG
jgi:Lipocalin-like domain